jgi:hypothetical protein
MAFSKSRDQLVANLGFLRQYATNQYSTCRFCRNGKVLPQLPIQLNKNVSSARKSKMAKACRDVGMGKTQQHQKIDLDIEQIVQNRASTVQNRTDSKTFATLKYWLLK